MTLNIFFNQVLAQKDCAVSEKPLVAKVTSIDTHFLSLIGIEVALSTLHHNKKLCIFTEFLLTNWLFLYYKNFVKLIGRIWLVKILNILVKMVVEAKVRFKFPTTLINKVIFDHSGMDTQIHFSWNWFHGKTF